MRYLLLAYRDEKRYQAMSTSERTALEEAYRSSERDLRQSRHLIEVTQIEDNAVLTVKIMAGRMTLADGPACECHEQLRELLFIQASDLNAAIQIALKLPQVQVGSIEVRPIVEIG